MTKHSLERTSPKRTPFIGRCTRCGARGLFITDVTKDCPNTSGMTDDQALIKAIRGE